MEPGVWPGVLITRTSIETPFSPPRRISWPSARGVTGCWSSNPSPAATKYGTPSFPASAGPPLTWSAWTCVSRTRTIRAPRSAAKPSYHSTWRLGSTTTASPPETITYDRQPLPRRLTCHSS